MSSEDLNSAVERAWYSDNWLAKTLVPLSWLFAAISRCRGFFLKRASRHQALPVPVVVVGNISVGGTGKTPLLITLIESFRAAGYRPGVISRGYGGKADHYPLLVTPETPAEQGGDEPVLIASRCGCPVIVDPDRLSAAQYLLTHTDCNLILSDDGLQHYRLPRDIEIVVVDGQRKFGNGRLLPAGPLREPVSRLSDADFVLVNGADTLSECSAAEPMKVEAVQELRALSGDRTLSARDWQFTRRHVHAVAGIGNPQRFVTTLTLLGFKVELHAFPDHHPFTAQDLLFDDDRPVIMTAKDAVKCRGLLPAEADHWVLDVVANVPESWLASLISKVNSISGKST